MHQAWCVSFRLIRTPPALECSAISQAHAPIISILLFCASPSGYYCEQARDDEPAIRHYQQALSTLRFLPATATTAFELKEVASFVNFKLVRLLLCTGKVAEACEQFAVHVQVWRAVQMPDDTMYMRVCCSV